MLKVGDEGPVKCQKQGGPRVVSLWISQIGSPQYGERSLSAPSGPEDHIMSLSGEIQYLDLPPNRCWKTHLTSIAWSREHRHLWPICERPAPQSQSLERHNPGSVRLQLQASL